jgi:hypothetical protein
MIGLRGLLLALAVILFVIAVFSDARYGDLLALGLAATAAALLTEDMGWNTRFGTRRCGPGFDPTTPRQSCRTPASLA